MISTGWMDEVRDRLARIRPAPEPAREAGGPPLRKAAVLLPLYVREKGLWILFTKRTDQVEHHKGQISFPGGGQEPDDATLWDTALRETEEELGIPRAGVRLLGALAPRVTVTDFEVFPFAGAIPYPTAFRPQAGEVEAVLEVPLSYLLEPEVVEERPIRWNGKEFLTLVFHYRGHAIWGATARILADFLSALRDGRSPDAAEPA